MKKKNKTLLAICKLIVRPTPAFWKKNKKLPVICQANITRPMYSWTANDVGLYWRYPRVFFCCLSNNKLMLKRGSNIWRRLYFSLHRSCCLLGQRREIREDNYIIIFHLGLFFVPHKMGCLCDTENLAIIDLDDSAYSLSVWASANSIEWNRFHSFNDRCDYI